MTAPMPNAETLQSIFETAAQQAMELTGQPITDSHTREVAFKLAAAVAASLLTDR